MTLTVQRSVVEAFPTNAKNVDVDYAIETVLNKLDGLYSLMLLFGRMCFLRHSVLRHPFRQL